MHYDNEREREDISVNLMLGDCLERMKEIESGSVDMILADVPYGTTACKWDSIIPLEPMWEQLKRIIKPNGAIVMTASQPFTTTLIASNMKMFKYCWVWEKERGTGFARAKKQPLRKHEDILVFYSKQPFYNGIGEKLEKPYKHALPINKSKSDNVAGSGYNKKGDRIYQTYTHSSKNTILKISRDSTKNSLHPTQKPVALMEYLIKTYTNENETVLDFTFGSCSTGVACVNTNRNFIGIELDEGYFKIGQDRINKALINKIGI
jgi:site-specific DNA-methyltransferase (adenine-specific)